MGSSQLVMLALCAASLAVSIATFVMAAREPDLRWKPAWALLALVGTGGAAMVWSAPGSVYWFFGVAVPTASYASVDGGWQPAMVRCLFPTGALIVLLRLYLHRARRLRSTRPTEPVSSRPTRSDGREA
jgi:hypothetical protein